LSQIQTYSANTNESAHSTTTTLTCTTCYKPNHNEASCFKKQDDLCNKSNYHTKPNEVADIILASGPLELGLATTQQISNTIFIGDSGVTCHMSYSTAGISWPDCSDRQKQ
jgi:hypothetical protein